MVELGANTEVFINKEVVISFVFEVSLRNGALFEVLTGTETDVTPNSGDSILVGVGVNMRAATKTASALILIPTSSAEV